MLVRVASCLDLTPPARPDDFQNARSICRKMRHACYRRCTQQRISRARRTDYPRDEVSNNSGVFLSSFDR